MIYTLEWIKKEATEVTLVNANPVNREKANDLLVKIQEVEDLVAELGI